MPAYTRRTESCQKAVALILVLMCGPHVLESHLA